VKWQPFTSPACEGCPPKLDQRELRDERVADQVADLGKGKAALGEDRLGAGDPP
jgi:hypothetical protein